jgi:hypothetical protein
VVISVEAAAVVRVGRYVGWQGGSAVNRRSAPRRLTEVVVFLFDRLGRSLETSREIGPLMGTPNHMAASIGAVAALMSVPIAHLVSTAQGADHRGRGQ